MAEEGKRRRNWSALWGTIWSGIFLITLGFLLREGFSIKALRRLVHYAPLFLVSIGILILGGGVIRWYTAEGAEEKH